MVEWLPGILKNCRETRNNIAGIRQGDFLMQFKMISCCGLTFSVNAQHNWTVIGVQVKEDWCSNQVLGKVPEERNRSKVGKKRRKIYIQHAKSSNWFMILE